MTRFTVEIEQDQLGFRRGDTVLVDQTIVPEAGDILAARSASGWRLCRFEEPRWVGVAGVVVELQRRSA